VLGGKKRSENHRGSGGAKQGEGTPKKSGWFAKSTFNILEGAGPFGVRWRNGGVPGKGDEGRFSVERGVPTKKGKGATSASARITYSTGEQRIKEPSPEDGAGTLTARERGGLERARDREGKVGASAR